VRLFVKGGEPVAPKKRRSSPCEHAHEKDNEGNDSGVD